MVAYRTSKTHPFICQPAWCLHVEFHVLVPCSLSVVSVCLSLCPSGLGGGLSLFGHICSLAYLVVAPLSLLHMLPTASLGFWVGWQCLGSSSMECHWVSIYQYTFMSVSSLVYVSASTPCCNHGASLPSGTFWSFASRERFAVQFATVCVVSDGSFTTFLVFLFFFFWAQWTKSES